MAAARAKEKWPCQKLSVDQFKRAQVGHFWRASRGQVAERTPWVSITTTNTPSGGLQTLSATYTLPEGGLQAVRTNFRVGYREPDGLVFAVNTGGCPCTSDPDCDDGLWCNCAETCDAFLDCQAGSDPCAPLPCDASALARIEALVLAKTEPLTFSVSQPLVRWGRMGCQGRKSAAGKP